MPLPDGRIVVPSTIVAPVRDRPCPYRPVFTLVQARVSRRVNLGESERSGKSFALTSSGG